MITMLNTMIRFHFCIEILYIFGLSTNMKKKDARREEGAGRTSHNTAYQARLRLDPN